MSRRAWTYIAAIYVVAVALVLQALVASRLSHPDWAQIGVLFALAVAAQLFRVEAPNHVFFYATPVVYFAGVLLLDPRLLFLLVAVSHAGEWLKERALRTDYLRTWYLQPFNIAMFWIAGRAAQAVYTTLTGHLPAHSAGQFAAVALTAFCYVAANHVLLGAALVLARGVSWRESGIFDWTSLASDLALLCVGSVIAILWYSSPWFIVAAVAPVLFMYQALLIPSLKRQAEMDAKTGLYNARHFSTLFSSELERAQRFDRPLAVIMADMDYLRDVNNNYGHLAGDVVLAGIADVIKATVRDYDIAARFGGEEFALVLPEVGEREAQLMADRLRQAIESARFTVSSSREPLHVTMSLGVASFPEHGTSMTELIAAADAAVYASKERGRNRVTTAGELARLELPAALPPAVEQALPVLQEPAVLPDSDSVAAGPPPSRPAGRARDAAPWFVGAVILAGLLVLLLGIALEPAESNTTIALLAALAMATELLEVDLFGQGTVSVSVGIAFAAALLSGVYGLACASLGIAAVHHLRQHRGIRQIERAAFNWAVHMLAGLPAVLAIALIHPSWEAGTLPRLIAAGVAAALVYYVIDTGLICIAVALSAGADLWHTWRMQYRWLFAPYVVLCLLGLALSVAYRSFGPGGTIIYLLPIFAMYFVQRQYIDQSKATLSELRRLNQDLFQAALHDYLTGIGNERAYGESLRRELAQESGAPFAVARLDVDEFRAVNHDHGRRYGDVVLTEIASILSSAAGADFAFRLATDEFALLIAGQSEAAALDVLERVRHEVESRLEGVTISCGVTEATPGSSLPDEINDQAAEALAESKRRGRNQVTSYDQIRADSRVTSTVQAQAVRRLLAQETVPVVFQPIWNVDLGTVFGYEALARLDSSDSVLRPQEAFDVATRLGRAQELDALCRQSALQRAAELPPDVLLFMNVAPESLELDRLTGSSLLSAVHAAGISPERVVLELTERSIVRLEVVIEQARRLRDAGFRLALDDTGAGNAGLSVLTQMQFDFVKVDRSIVGHAQTDRAARAVLAGIFALAREMDAFVIVEGIESLDMLALVREVSGPQPAAGSPGRGAQGYLLGRPEPAVLEPRAAGSLETFVDRFLGRLPRTPSYLAGER